MVSREFKDWVARLPLAAFCSYTLRRSSVPGQPTAEVAKRLNAAVYQGEASASVKKFN